MNSTATCTHSQVHSIVEEALVEVSSGSTAQSTSPAALRMAQLQQGKASGDVGRSGDAVLLQEGEAWLPMLPSDASQVEDLALTPAGRPALVTLNHSHWTSLAAAGGGGGGNGGDPIMMSGMSDELSSYLTSGTLSPKKESGSGSGRG